jgi:hypothetical protein
LSEHDDNRAEDEDMTRVIDTEARDLEDEERWIDDESDEDGWDADENHQELPPRPRGRLLRPLPLFLVALIVAAAGFLGGVLAQKGSEGGAGVGGPEGGSLPPFAAQAGGSGGGSSEGGAAASGTVTGVRGHTIYVKESDGTTVAVKVGDGATVTRDSNVAAKKIHPGDTVTVEGSKHGSTVKASSVAASESGEGEIAVESLFEE